MMEREDVRVLAVAARLVAAARGEVESYAGPRAPLRIDEVSALLAAAGCHLEVFAFRSSAVAMTLPRCAGVYPVLVNRAASDADRTFALRHEVAHVLAGDADGAVCLADEGYMAFPERVADLFALADLVPGWWIADLRRDRAPWRAVLADVAEAVAVYAESWPSERRDDRARLRLRLFRHQSI